jgi:hypothetical protein
MPSVDDLMEGLAKGVEPSDIVELSKISTEELIELLRSHLVSNATEIIEYLED